MAKKKTLENIFRPRMATSWGSVFFMGLLLWSKMSVFQILTLTKVPFREIGEN